MSVVWSGACWELREKYSADVVDGAIQCRHQCSCVAILGRCCAIDVRVAKERRTEAHVGDIDVLGLRVRESLDQPAERPGPALAKDFDGNQCAFRCHALHAEAIDGYVVIANVNSNNQSVIGGASATGVRAYTASSSQGLLLMTEVIYYLAGTRLPVVITGANRGVSAPISLQPEHHDSQGLRDTGIIQLYVESAQEAYDAHIQAFKIAEDHRVLLPVMVCAGAQSTQAVTRSVMKRRGVVTDVSTADDYRIDSV